MNDLVRLVIDSKHQYVARNESAMLFFPVDESTNGVMFFTKINNDGQIAFFGAHRWVLKV